MKNFNQHDRKIEKTSKMKVMLLSLLGMFGSTHVNAQEISQDTVPQAKVVHANQRKKQENTSKTYQISRKDIAARTWLKTKEGKQALKAYQDALATFGDSVQCDMSSSEEVVSLMALSKMDLSMASIGDTDYTFDAEDLLGVTSDSMAIEIAKEAPKWITPSGVSGGYCAHATKGLVYKLGVADGFIPIDMENACEVALPENDSPNFVTVQVDWNNTDKIPDGAICVAGKEREGFLATKSGHIWTSVATDSRQVKTCVVRGEEVSYVAHHDVCDKNYNANLTGKRGSSGQWYGEVVYANFTAGSQVSFVTLCKKCIYDLKKEYRENSAVLQNSADLKDFHFNITPTMILKQAVSNKEEAFVKYNRLQEDGSYQYVLNEPVKISLVAKNAYKKGSGKTKKSPVRFAAVQRRGGRG